MPAARRWTLRAGLFLLPLAYSSATYDGWVLPKLLVARLLVFALALLLVTEALQQRTVVVKRTPLDLPLLAFAASAALSTILAVNVNVALFGTYERYDGLLTTLTYVALFWLAVQSIEGPDDARMLLRVGVAGAYVAAAVAIVQSVVDSLGPPNLSLVGTDAVQGSIVRAYGSLGQWEVLGEVLVLSWPIALWEASVARSFVPRALALNAALVIGLAIVLTFSRSAWAAAALAGCVLLAGSRPWASRRRLVATLLAVAAMGLAAVALALAGGSRFEEAIVHRASTLIHPAQWDIRPTVWGDSVKLISSRPLAGYGPDTFGLVFPRFNSHEYGVAIDKAHAELLQIAATQGLVGVASYVWMVVAFLVSLWRSRGRPGVYAVLAGFIAYEGMLQVNFSAIGSAMPFWIFAAAAMHFSGGVRNMTPAPLGRPAIIAMQSGAAMLMAATVVGVILPYVADASLLTAFRADRTGDVATARSASREARQLAPRESVYAVEVGNIAFERSDWRSARDAYTVAAELGTYNAFVYHNLAVADRELGLMVDGRAAARAAYELDRFDPVNQALLAQFEPPA